MGRISIVCPSCRAKLSFNEMVGWQEKFIECPHCHFKSKASVYQGGASNQGGYGASDEATQMPRISRPSQMAEIGVIKVCSTGLTFQLKEGTNIIGRIAKTGTADLKISNDPYMSRRHMQIDVIKTPFGTEHRLVEIDSKNIIVLNGQIIHREDVLKLSFGDKLTLGQTEIVFDRPQSDDDEATQLI